jgi:hypothetical protein
MTGILIEVDEILSESLDFGGDDYQSKRKSVIDNLKEISAILGSVDDDVIEFASNFFKLRGQVAPVSVVQKCVDAASDYSAHVLSLLPLLLTIQTVRFITTEDDISTFFLALCKKAKFSAAELGDEDNESFLKACVQIIDYSFFEELEEENLTITSNTVKFSDVINEGFKKALWERVDVKVELLKHLKKEVFADEDLLKAELESVEIEQSQAKESISSQPGNI